MTDILDLAGRVALVTGAGQGVGRQIALHLAAHNAGGVVVNDFVLARAEAAMAAGVRRDRIWLDPGIGFGKTVAHNLALLAALPRLSAHGFPVLLATSRKRFIAALDPANPDPGHRLGGSLATALWGADRGCALVRCHDVAATVQALTLWSAMQGAFA